MAYLKMKLSIIVPIYNVEPYLRRCVDSLLAQDLAEDGYEIILVDDGSTDGSGQVADALAAQHTNVHVIHKKNEGVSVARNTAMAVAKGKYVQFVDADDYIMPNVLGELVAKMDAEQLEMLRFNYRFVDDNGDVTHPNKYSQPDDYSDSICDGLTFLNERLGGGCYAWQFMFAHELTCINFMHGIALGEDTYWTIQMLMRVKRITSVDSVIYNYFVRGESATFNPSPAKRQKRLDDQLWIISKMQTEFKPQMNDRRWLDGQIANTAISVLTTVALHCYGERQHYINELKRNKVFPIANHHLTPSAQRKRRWINISPRLFCYLVHLKNKVK